MKSKKLSYKNIVAILFSAFILFYFVTIAERTFRSAVLGQNLSDTVQSESEVSGGGENSIDWASVYPPEDDGMKDAPEEELDVVIKKPNGYEEIVGSIEEKVDYFTNKLIFLRMKFVELNARFNKLIGNKLISGSDEIVSLSDGNLTYTPKKYDMTRSAENFAGFSEYLKEKDIDLLYVQAPSKVDPEKNYLPAGIEDYDNQNADIFIDMLNKRGIKCLDLRKSMNQQNINYSDSFYKTDHHWKINISMWAADQLAQSLEEYGIPYKKDLLDINNYNSKVYKNYMFGSMGKKVSLAYAEPEDFTLYTPKFDTDYTVNYYDKILNGSFVDTLIDMSVLKEIDYYNTSVYSAYAYGVLPLVSIDNNKADNDKKILFINDSFGNSLVPFYSTQVGHIDKIDLRYFHGGVKAFIEKNKPDVVVVLYYASSLSDNSEYCSFRFR